MVVKKNPKSQNAIDQFKGRQKINNNNLSGWTYPLCQKFAGFLVQTQQAQDLFVFFEKKWGAQSTSKLGNRNSKETPTKLPWCKTLAVLLVPC